MTTLKVGLSHAEWGVWLRWMAANIAGWVIGLAGGFGIGKPLGFAIGGEGFGGAVMASGLPPLLAGVMVGPLVGVMQWLVLRRQVSRSGWWVLATAMGWYMGCGLSVVVGLVFVSKLGLLVLLAPPGITLGVMQWLVLRRQVFRAGWWVLASAAGWATGSLLVAFLDPASGALAYLSLFLYLLTPSAITGFALIWLLRQPVPRIGRLEIAATGIDP